MHDGTRTFDGELARIVPGRDRNVHKLSQTMRRADYPLAAIASVAYEQVRKAGQLRLRRATAPTSTHVTRRSTHRRRCRGRPTSLGSPTYRRCPGSLG